MEETETWQKKWVGFGKMKTVLRGVLQIFLYKYEKK